MERDLYNEERHFLLSTGGNTDFYVTKFNSETEEVFIEEFFENYNMGNGTWCSLYELDENERRIVKSKLNLFELEYYAYVAHGNYPQSFILTSIEM